MLPKMPPKVFKALGPFWLCDPCKSGSGSDEEDSGSNGKEIEENNIPISPPSNVNMILAPAKLVSIVSTNDDKMDWEQGLYNAVLPTRSLKNKSP